MSYGPMSFADYQKQVGLNATVLKAGAKSMLHMRWAIYNPMEETPAMRWGRLLHLAILEPQEFGRKVRVYNGARRAGKDWDQFIADCNGTDEWIIKSDEQGELLAISGAVHADPDAHRLISSTVHELCLTWETPDYGKAKARLDGYSESIGIVELKTTSAIMPMLFAKQCINLGYDIQFAWYTEGIKAQQLPCPAVHVIALESAPPYAACVYRVPPTMMGGGLNRALDIAKRYRACEQSGVFPGPQQGIQELPVPAWYAGDTPLALVFGDETVTV